MLLLPSATSCCPLSSLCTLLSVPARTASPQLPEDLVPCLAAVRDAARRVGKVAAECNLPGVSDVC